MQNDLKQQGTSNENGMEVIQKEMGVAGKQSSASSATTKEILSLLYKQGFRCAYTGEALTPGTTAGDHKIPVSRGGDHSIENIAMVKREVNTAKHTMTVEEFVAMCKKVAVHFAGDLPLQTEIPFPVPVGLIPPDANPTEILVRLGYAGAAEEVDQMKQQIATFKKNARHGGRKLTQEEYQGELGAKILGMRAEITRLQCKRSMLRRETGWAENKDAIEPRLDHPTLANDTVKSS